MAKRAQREAKKETGRVWQQRATRTAILTAARNLIELDGADTLTLARVAMEADFATTTVFAYFLNKTDLMLAILADDLAELAREMRDTYPVREEADAEAETEIADADFAEEVPAETLESSPVTEVASDASEFSDALADIEAELAAGMLTPDDAIAELAIPSDIAAHLAAELALDPPASAAGESARTDRLAPECEEPTDAAAAIEPGLPELPLAEIASEFPAEQQELVDAAATIEPEASSESLVENSAEFSAGQDEPVHTEANAEWAPSNEQAETVAEASDTPASATQEPVCEATPDAEIVAEAAPAGDSESAGIVEQVHADADEPGSHIEDGHIEGVQPLQPDLRPHRMPVVEKKWTLQVEPDRAGDTTAAIARLEESVAKLEERRVDAWLERRLRELERMIASLEQRQGSSEAPAVVVEGSIRALEVRLNETEASHQAALERNEKSSDEKIDAAEKRLKQAVADLRGLTMEASSRLDVLERAAPAPAFHAYEESPVADGSAPTVEQARESETVADGAAKATVEDRPATGPSYLSHARRSAMAAAAQTVAQPSEPMQRFASTMSSIKTASRGSRYFVAGGIALLVVALGAGIALKRQAADTAETSAPAPAHQTVLHAKAQAQTLSPQIRLATLAARDNAQAQLLLGLEYLDGKGAAKNETEAAQWIGKSAAHGNAVAQFWLGTLYANGRGVKADPTWAIHWYEEAAMQGNRKAMHQLAVSYAEGWGAAKNYPEAARWFSRAATLGYVDSAFNLGVLYERGLGMPQSLLDAYKWYSIAAAMGDKVSPARIAVLKTQMNAADMTAATQAASSFAPDPMDQSANMSPQLSALPRS